MMHKSWWTTALAILPKKSMRYLPGMAWLQKELALTKLLFHILVDWLPPQNCALCANLPGLLNAATNAQ
eukprot:1364845-Karenia_brevis.AAC.1